VRPLHYPAGGFGPIAQAVRQFDAELHIQTGLHVGSFQRQWQMAMPLKGGPDGLHLEGCGRRRIE
jgi:hypothetical protein